MYVCTYKNVSHKAENASYIPQDCAACLMRKLSRSFASELPDVIVPLSDGERKMMGAVHSSSQSMYMILP